MAVQEVVQRPAPFIEALGKTYADELTKTVGGLKDIDITQFQGRGFVAPESQLTEQARGLASGLGSFQPFLTQAQAVTGPQAYQAYMSPYQQDVIDTTLSEFDRQAARGLPALSARAIASGAFGGGREGVERAEYQAASDRNRAALQAQLLQSGFGQAQQAAQTDFLRNVQLAQTSPALAGQQISALGALGTQQQAQQQALLEADKQLAFQQAYQPLQATQTLGQGVMGLISGYPGQTREMTTPSPTALQTGLGVASTLAGIYSKINPRPLFNIGS
jgi:hypothetical protein